MNQKILAFNQSQLKKNPPLVQPGDTVKVYQKIIEGNKERIQVFEGVVLKVNHGYGLPGSFTVRKIATAGVAVERTFPIHSPTIVKVERLKSAKVRRARLYYLRQNRGGSIKLKHELRSPHVWEEPEAEQALEKIHEEQEAEAKQKELEKQKVEEELEKKFVAAKGVIKKQSAKESSGNDAPGSKNS